MSHEAFLRAIASEPADDTARLAYADYLEETGEPTHVARAGFIRTQIEAHSLHENHPRREELEARAEALFADHWAAWWVPVCDAIGLPRPSAASPGLRERVARFFGRGPAPSGLAYDPAYGTTLEVVQPRPPTAQTTLRTITFERGFPESVSLLGQLREVREPIHRWTTAAPLTSLHLHGTVGREWQHIDGEHLRGVREMVLDSCAATAVTAVAASPHLPRLEALTLRPDRSNIAWPAEQYRAYAESSLATRVRQLRVVVTREEEVRALHGPRLANLVGLGLDGLASDDPGLLLGVADVLTRSPHLTGLTDLTLTGEATSFAGALAARLARQLRRLTLDDVRNPDVYCSWLCVHPFSVLTDLTITTRDRIEPIYTAIATSPLAGRLRHLRLYGGLTSRRRGWGELSRMVNTLDPETLQTLAVNREVRGIPEVWGELQERFPGRVSLV